jgi:hypothetical protein
MLKVPVDLNTEQKGLGQCQHDAESRLKNIFKNGRLNSYIWKNHNAGINKMIKLTNVKASPLDYKTESVRTQKTRDRERWLIADLYR